MPGLQRAQTIGDWEKQKLTAETRSKNEIGDLDWAAALTYVGASEAAEKKYCVSATQSARQRDTRKFREHQHNGQSRMAREMHWPGP